MNDGETFISSDELMLNMWHLQRPESCFPLIDELPEVFSDQMRNPAVLTGCVGWYGGGKQDNYECKSGSQKLPSFPLHNKCKRSEEHEKGILKRILTWKSQVNICDLRARCMQNRAAQILHAPLRYAEQETCLNQLNFCIKEKQEIWVQRSCASFNASQTQILLAMAM